MSYPAAGKTAGYVKMRTGKCSYGNMSVPEQTPVKRLSLFQFSTDFVGTQSTFMTADEPLHKFDVSEILSCELIADGQCLSDVLSCQWN